jgi:pimeloyl-ACP methyl ester carboxylesterase
LHYIRLGSGAPPIFFVHGFACSHQDWRLQLADFSRDHEVIACDLRGHGATPGRPQECSIEHYGGDVAALVNNLEGEPAILVGHSMGCRVVLEANRALVSSGQGERVAGIVLIDGSRNPGSDPLAAERAARAIVDRTGYAEFAATFFRDMFLRPSPEADAIVARAVNDSAEFGADLWPRISRWDAGEMDGALAAVRAPLLAIQSTKRGADLRRSPMQPGDTSPWLDDVRSRVANARIEIVPDTGHFTMLEQPEKVNALISDFVAACR